MANLSGNTVIKYGMGCSGVEQVPLQVDVCCLVQAAAMACDEGDMQSVMVLILKAKRQLVRLNKYKGVQSGAKLGVRERDFIGSLN